jgi:hypothetical protein
VSPLNLSGHGNSKQISTIRQSRPVRHERSTGTGIQFLIPRHPLPTRRANFEQSAYGSASLRFGESIMLCIAIILRVYGHVHTWAPVGVRIEVKGLLRLRSCFQTSALRFNSRTLVVMEEDQYGHDGRNCRTRVEASEPRSFLTSILWIRFQRLNLRVDAYNLLTKSSEPKYCELLRCV